MARAEECRTVYLRLLLRNAPSKEAVAVTPSAGIGGLEMRVNRKNCV